MTSPQLPSQPISSPYALLANGANGATSGLAEFASWTKADWDAFLSGKWVPHFDGIGGPLAAAWEWINAITSAFQGDFGPLEDLLGEVVEGFVAGFNDLRAAFEGTYTGSDPVLSAIQTFIGGKWSGLGNAQTMLQQIADILNGLIVTPINSAVQGVKDWFAGLVGWQSTTTSNVADATSSASAANTKSQNLIDALIAGLGGSGTGHTVAEVQAAIANLNNVPAASSVTPAYAADLEDMATALRSQLAWPSVASGAAATTGRASGDTDAYTGSTLSGHVHGLNSHTHSVPAHSHTVSVVMPTYTPDRVFGSSTAYVDFTPCWVDRRGEATTVSWVVGADTSIFSIDAYYMGLMIYNPDNGNLEKVWDSGDIKNGVANTTTLQEVILDMALVGQEYTPGQLLFLAHQQIAPGLVQAARSFACVPQAGIGRPSSWTDSHGVVHERLLDAASYRSPSRLGSIPASISFSSLTRVNTRIPWGALGVNTEAV